MGMHAYVVQPLGCHVYYPLHVNYLQVSFQKNLSEKTRSLRIVVRKFFRVVALPNGNASVRSPAFRLPCILPIACQRLIGLFPGKSFTKKKILSDSSLTWLKNFLGTAT